MNIQSMALLAVVAAAFVMALYRFVRGQKRSGGCGSCGCNCNCENCHKQ